MAPGGRSRRATNSTALVVIISFVAVVASFLAGTWVTERAITALDEAALSVAENAVPSIRSLLAMRQALRRLEWAVEDYVEDRAAGLEAPRPRVAALRADVQRWLDAAFATGVYAGEPEVREAIRAAVAKVDAVDDRLLALVDQGHADRAAAAIRTSLRPAIDELGAAVLRDIDVNNRGAEQMTHRIQSARLRARRISLVLDGASVLAAMAIAAACLHVIRAHERLAREHTALVERRADELEGFAGRIAHDVLSPLANVAMSLELAQRSADPASRATLERARSSLFRVREIVDALYAFAGAGAAPEAGASTRVGGVLDGVVDEVAATAPTGTELRVEAPAREAEVACRPGILVTLLSNLLRNALKYGAADGASPRIAVRALADGPRVRFEVEDAGPGVPPGMEARIFEPHVRAPSAARTRPGLGLGLATAKRLAEAHGGAVGVRPAGDRGSVFWFELPAAARTPPSETSTK